MRSGDDRIDEWVRRASAARCTIVDAPAGYGKSLLLESIAAASARPIWLDRADDLVAVDQLAENHDATYLLDGVSAIEAASAAVVGSNVRGSETPNVEGPRSSLADRVEGLLRTAPDVQLVIAGRNLDPVVRRLGTRPASHLIEAEDLAHSADQLHDLLVDRGAGAGVAAAAAAQIDEASGGWPVLARALVEIVAASGLDGLAKVDHGSKTVGPLLAPVLDEIRPEDRITLVQLALLPRLDDTVLEALEARRLVGRLLDLGVPVTRSRDGTWRFPPAVRNYVAAGQEIDREVVSRVVPGLVEGGQAMEGARLLLQTAGPAAAGEFLVGLPPAAVDGLEPDELASMLELLDDESTRWPRLLLLRATAEAGRAGLQAQRTLLERAVSATDGHDAEQVRGEAEAELIFTRALADGYSSQFRSEVEAAIQVRGENAPGRREIRLIEALGVLVASQETSDAMEEASLVLDRAARLWQHVGEYKRACATLRLVAIQALIPLGRYVEAEAAMAKAHQLSQGGTTEWARNIVVTARVAALAARADAARHLAVADELGRTLRQPWIAAYADWSRMLIEGIEGRTDAQLALQDRAWSQLGELREHSTGLIFLCEACVGLARAGRIDEAARTLERARPRRHQAELEFELAELAVQARRAPVEDVRASVETLLGGGRVPLARRWALLLHLAVALDRSGSPEALVVLDRVKLESELCGLADLPLRLEPGLFERAANQPTESIEADGTQPIDEVSVQLLGRFSVSRGGQEISLSSARVTELVKVLAVRAGSAPIDLVLDNLWPEVEPATGRRRLKNVLSRARAELGDVLVRERDRIAFSSSVGIDLSDFDLAARQAVLLAQTDPSRAAEAGLRALSLYMGELLPDDRYADWAELARADIRARSLALVDVVLADPTIVTTPENVAAVTEILLRIDPHDPERLRELAARCTDAGNLASASALRRLLERADPWTTSR